VGFVNQVLKMAEVEDYINQIADPRERRALQAILDHINERTATFPLKISNVEVTSTAAELNKLDGVTRTMAEINALLQCSTAQYKVVHGLIGLTATTNVDTGLSSVYNVFFDELKTTGKTTVQVTWRDSYEAGRITLYGWKQSTTLGTLVAASAAASIRYLALGSA
jgi:hypothetical protein